MTLKYKNPKKQFNFNNMKLYKSKKLPKNYMGFKVYNADKTDLRFKDPKNVIAGLYAKGKARHDTSGFVID